MHVKLPVYLFSLNKTNSCSDQEHTKGVSQKQNFLFLLHQLLNYYLILSGKDFIATIPYVYTQKPVNM